MTYIEIGEWPMMQAAAQAVRTTVFVDEQGIAPEDEWDADDADFEGKEPAKAMILSLFNGIEQNAMRIDLWTSEMRVDEMNLFMFQTLATLADTFERATNNKELAEEMRDFVHHFGHRVEVFGDDHVH